MTPGSRGCTPAPYRRGEHGRRYDIQDKHADKAAESRARAVCEPSYFLMPAFRSSQPWEPAHGLVVSSAPLLGNEIDMSSTDDNEILIK